MSIGRCWSSNKGMNLELLDRCLLKLSKAFVKLGSHITASIEVRSKFTIGFLHFRSILKVWTVLK